MGVWKSCVHLWDRSDYLSPDPGQRYTVQFSDPGQRTFRNTHANEAELEEYAQKFERAERARADAERPSKEEPEALPGARSARRRRAGGALVSANVPLVSLSVPLVSLSVP